MRRKLTGSKPKLSVPAGTTDTHMHLYLPGFPAEPGAQPLPPDPPGVPEYLQVMDWLGIDRVVVVQGNSHGFSNENLVAALDQLGAKARGVGIIAGETPDAEIERLHKAGVRAARVMNLNGATRMDRLAEVDARAKEVGWSLIVQFDGAEILERMPALEAIRCDWVLDHHGKFLGGIPAPDGPEIAALKRLLDRGNFYFKLGAVNESSRVGLPGFDDVAAYTRVLAAHAPERMLWATNWPHNMITREEDYMDEAEHFDRVTSWADGEEGRRLMLVENPARLYGF